MTTSPRSPSVGAIGSSRLGSTSSEIRSEYKTTSWLGDFTVESTIGRGLFAVVKKCVENSTGKKFAAKIIRKRRHNRDCTQDILHEIAVLELSSNHPHLIDLYQVYESPSDVVLILEYAAGGEIFDHCVGLKDNFTEAISRRLLSQILEGVVFLHERNIVHLDLKPQNILLTKEGTNPNADIKLVDFGLSKHITNGLEVREIIGTPDYVAPEVLNYEPITTATDIWSLGVVSYVMLTGVSPFLGDTKQETLMNVTTGAIEFPSDLFDGLSPACKDFMHNMLQRDPSDRWSAKQSQNHPWISGLSSPSAPMHIDLIDEASDDPVFSNDDNDSEENEPCQVPRIKLSTFAADPGRRKSGGRKNDVTCIPDVAIQDVPDVTDDSEDNPNASGSWREEEDLKPNTDYNDNVVFVATETKNSIEISCSLGQVKRRRSSEGDSMRTPIFGVTETNFAQVVRQDLAFPCCTTDDSFLLCKDVRICSNSHHSTHCHSMIQVSKGATYKSGCKLVAREKGITFLPVNGKERKHEQSPHSRRPTYLTSPYISPMKLADIEDGSRLSPKIKRVEN